MDKAAFYKSLRRRESGVFGTSLSQRQVEGCEAILDECLAQRATLKQTAYILATAYGETGGKMQPVRENLNYSAAQIAKHFGAHRRQGKTPAQLARNPRLLGNTVYGGEWGLKNLGNIPGTEDGYNLRGWGIGQWTGRRNTENAARQVGMDLLSNPALLDDIKVNAQLLVRWMLQGGATGKKLSDFINEGGTAYFAARSVWGGVDAAKYVEYAKAFEAALEAAGYNAAEPAFPPPPDVEPITHPDPAEKPQGILAAIIAAIRSIFGGRK